jgi:hypothetical protein
MKFILVLFLISGSIFAAEEVDYIHEVSDEAYRKTTARLYRAEGEHQCQSKDSIGHTCKNLGVNFTDCNHAHFSLKRDDCCSGSDYGGISIAFKLTKCTNFN